MCMELELRVSVLWSRNWDDWTKKCKRENVGLKLKGHAGIHWSGLDI